MGVESVALEWGLVMSNTVAGSIVLIVELPTYSVAGSDCDLLPDTVLFAKQLVLFSGEVELSF